MVKVGIIGLGKWGKNHLRLLSKLPVHVVGIADVDGSKRQLAEEFDTNFFTDYKKLLPLVDAVSVVVPTNYHYQVVREALESGKHVLVEKPVTDDAEKTRELVGLASEKGLLLSVGYLYRFNPAVQKLKELVKTAGRLQYITARYVHSTNPPRKDSGAVLNLGIHMIDILNFVLEDRPKRVYCKLVNSVHPKREDSAMIMLDYGHFFASVEVSSCHPEKKRDMWVIAEKEKIYADFLEQQIIRYPILISEEKVEAGKETHEEIFKNEPLAEQLKYFVDMVENCNNGRFKEIVNLGEEEYYTSRICELALKSAEFKRDLDIE